MTVTIIEEINDQGLNQKNKNYRAHFRGETLGKEAWEVHQSVWKC